MFKIVCVCIICNSLMDVAEWCHEHVFCLYKGSLPYANFEKIALLNICVSGTEGGPQLTRKLTYKCKPKIVVKWDPQ